MIQSNLVLAAIIAAVAAVAFWLDYRFARVSKIGASLLAIVFGAILSNAGLVPATSGVYDAIGGPVTSLAIAWLLLAVNVRDLRHAGARMMTAYGLAVLGTIAGVTVATALLASRFGDQSWRLAGTLTGTYTGGSLNFVAVGRGVGLEDTLFAAATAADNIATALWLGATLILPLWLAKLYPTPIPAQAVDPGGSSDRATHHPFFAGHSVSTLDLAILVAVGFGLLVAADTLAVMIPGIPSVLWLTTVALLTGHLTPLGKRAGAMQLGNLALHFFFVVIGIHSRIADLLSVGVEVLYFTLIVVGVHGVVVYGLGRLARIDVASLSVASQAAVGGPASALAVAVAREWRALVLPGVIVGLLGYAVGNYLGFAVAYLLRSMGLGG